MPNECERISEQWPPFADAFREIHRFILKAMDGDAAAANGLFQKYLNGELPEDLLRISRSWVQEEQACPSKRSGGANTGVADPQAIEHLALARPVERRLRRIRKPRRGVPHSQGAGRAGKSSQDVGERA
jgi:hypothetical protein